MLTRADIYRTQAHLVIESDLPGVDEDDVRLWVSRDRLCRTHTDRVPLLRWPPETTVKVFSVGTGSCLL